MSGLAHWLGDEPERPFDHQEPESQSPAQFVLDRLARIIADQGGAELPERCLSRELDDLTRAADPVPTATCGCGGRTLFTLPYVGVGEQPLSLRACAVCDLATRWPRLQP